MKKTYNSPVFDVEVFAANEYVASCYYLACDVTTANNYEAENNYFGFNAADLNHSSSECGNPSHQIISTNGTVTETSSYLGNLPCTVSGEIKTGAYVTWTTTDGSRVWHHFGTVGAQDSNHPNRS